MPHLILEYDAALDGELAIPALLQALHNATLETGLFDEKVIKVRTLPCPHSLVGGRPNTFAHLTAAVLPGRDAATKEALSASLLAVLLQYLPDPAAVSVETRDLQAYCKKAVL